MAPHDPSSTFTAPPRQVAPPARRLSLRATALVLWLFAALYGAVLGAFLWSL